MQLALKRNVLLLVAVLMSQTACASLITQLAKLTAPPAQTTTSLDGVVLTGGIETNLYPSELGTIAQSFFNGWRSGGDLVSLMFSKKGSSGFYRIDGTVTVDGAPAEYLMIGNYSVISGPNPAPRKIEITTTTGEKSSFTIAPSKSRLKVLSINGLKSNVALDLSKDVVVELEATQVPENTLVKVGLAINQVGIKSLYDVCYVKYQPKITIPAAAFRNINIKPGASLLFNYNQSFLSVAVESQQEATDVSGKFASVQYTSGSSDGMFVTVNKEPELNPGLSVKGSEANMDYEVFKPGAFLSRPSDQIKKIGVISLSVRGTTFHQSSDTNTTKNTLVMGGIANTTTTTTTTITTLEFPKQTDEAWDALLEEMYPALVGVVKAEFGADDVLVDKVTGTDAYKGTVAFAKDDQNTKVHFARSFRKTKVLSAFMPVTEGYGANGVNQRIMNEAGADALVTLTLDLEISQSKDDKVMMMPRLAFEVVGKANGNNTNTKYFAGTIRSTTGVTFSKTLAPGQLEAIVRKSDLVTVFHKALKEIREKEKANGDYGAVWNLQK